MIEHHGATAEGIRVYYNILESDIEGRPPTDPAFDARTKSPLQVIAKQGDKVLIVSDNILHMYQYSCLLFSVVQNNVWQPVCKSVSLT